MVVYNPPEGRSATKPVIWEGDSLTTNREFPASIRAAIGKGLRALQLGVKPENSRPMYGIGPGVFELKAHDASGQYRAIYVLIVKGQVHVLHCFKKTSQKTSKHDIEVAARRFKAVRQRGG